MSILIALLVLCAFLSGFGLKRLLDAARKARAARAGEAQVERDTYRDERDAALAKVERLTEALKYARPYVRQKAEAGDEVAEEELAKIDGALEAKE